MPLTPNQWIILAQSYGVDVMDDLNAKLAALPEVRIVSISYATGGGYPSILAVVERI